MDNVYEVKTERGDLIVTASYNSAEMAEQDGYEYLYYSPELRCDVDSKAESKDGLKQSYALVNEFA